MGTLPTFLERGLHRPVKIAFDLIVVIGVTIVSYLLAYGLRLDFEFHRFPDSFSLSVGALALALLRCIFYLVFRIPGQPWRFSSTDDLVALIKAHLAATILFPGVVLFLRLDDFSRSAVLIEWLVSCAIAGGLRVSVRLLFERAALYSFGSDGARQPVVILGAGETGRSLVRLIRSPSNTAFVASAILDDAVPLHGTKIHGVSIVGPLMALADLLKSRGDVRVVILAIPSFPANRLAKIRELCAAAKVNFLRIDSLAQIAFQQSLASSTSAGIQNQLPMEALFERMEVAESDPAVNSLVEGKRIVVTGAGGSIGSEIVRQLVAKRPAILRLVDHSEFNLFSLQQQLGEISSSTKIEYLLCDVRDRAALKRAFGNDLDLVIHAAAYKHVPLIESNAVSAFQVNVVGTLNAIQVAHLANAKLFLFISSDKAVDPCNVMGATKLAAEWIVRCGIQDVNNSTSLATTVVRFGNVVGSTGSVVPIFREQILSGGPITITHPEVQRYFMSIPEAVSLVLNSLVISRRGATYVLDMGNPISLVDLARRMLLLANRPDIEFRFSGLRPGERLNERLTGSDEVLQETRMSKIFEVASSHKPDQDFIDEILGVENRLAQCGVDSEAQLMVRDFLVQRQLLNPGSGIP